MAGGGQLVGGDPDALRRVADVFGRVASELGAAGQDAVKASGVVAPDPPAGSIGEAINASCAQVNEFMLDVTALMEALTHRNGAATAAVGQTLGQTAANATDVAAGWGTHH